MKKDTKKNDGPSCACGKVDLYEEWLKNEKKNKEASESETTASKQTKEGSTPADSQTK